MGDPDIEWILELLSSVGPVRARKMFGGYGIYHDDRMFALVADSCLFLKVDALSKPSFSAAGCEPFIYESGGKRVAMSYWSVPDAAMDSIEAMQAWARQAWEAAERTPLAKRRSRKKPRG